MKKNSTFKHEKQSPFYIFFAFLTFILFFIESCKKEPVQQNNLGLTSNTRLSLSQQNFEDIYLKLRKTSNKEQVKEFIALKNSKPNFISLNVSNLDFKISETFKRVSKIGIKKINALSVINETEPFAGNGNQPGYDEVLPEIIDDNSFSMLLNEEGEIQVDNIIYKVTPFGTFFADISHEALLNSVFDNVYIQNDYTLRLYDLSAPVSLSNIDVTNTAYNDVKLLNKHVYFVDSFIESEAINNNPINFPNDQETLPFIFPLSSFSQTNKQEPEANLPLEMRQTNYLTTSSVSSMPNETDPAYQQMAEYKIDFKSGAGSILQTVFENSTRYNNFNKNYRVSVLMYNRNYGLFKTLGIKVKFQKKGFLWWNKTSTTEIRGGWDYIAYSSAISVPKISLPNTDNPPSTGDPYLINPYENPYYAAPMWGASQGSNGYRYNLYGWHMKRGSNELFTVMIPGWLIPFKPDGLEVKSSAFKAALKFGWDKLKAILVKSAPPSIPSIINNDPYNYKFPIYELNGGGGKKYLSINDMEHIPKSFTSNLSRTDVLKDTKIHTFISPYEQVVYNDDSIDIPLDLSTVKITITSDPSNIALSATQILKSLLTEELATSFEVKTASIFGAAKYNGQWLGIRLKVQKD